MATSFGVRVGTSSTCIAVNKDGASAVLANAAGDRVTPAVVSFNNGELSVGLTSRIACNNLYNCVRLVGNLNLESEEIAKIIASSACKIVKGAKGEVFYEVTGVNGKPTKYSTKHVLGLIFKQLLDTAKSHSGIQGDRTAVLVVSLEYTEDQVTAISEAATSAGFKVLQVIKEPCAALLGAEIKDKLGFTNKHRIVDGLPRFCLVYRVGGNSLDATIVRVQNGLLRIVASVHRNDLGGEKVSRLLTTLLADEFKRRHKVDVSDNPRALLKLQQAAEESKRILSALVTTNCTVESLCDGIDFTCPLSRSMFEIMFNNVLPQFLRPLEDVLEKANLKVEKVEIVVLCGGTCRIPQLQKAVAQYFTSPQLVVDASSPDEIVAIGAANQAMYLGHEEPKCSRNDAILPVITRNIYYKVSDADDSQRKRVFNAGTIIPVRKEVSVTLEGAANNWIAIDVFAEDENCEGVFEPIFLEETLTDLPEDLVDIPLLFEVTRDGRLEVSVAQKRPAKSKSKVTKDCDKK